MSTSKEHMEEMCVAGMEQAGSPDAPRETGGLIEFDVV